MKKLFTLFAFMCLMVSGAWADFEPYTPEKPVSYVLTNAQDVTIASNLTICANGSSEGKFGFIAQDGGGYKIIEATSNKYVALSEDATAECQNGTKLVDAEADGEVFTITPLSDEYAGQYLISPTKINVNPTTPTYLNFMGGAEVYPEGYTIGFWKDGDKDAGSRWIFEEEVTYTITITGVPDGETAELKYKGTTCGDKLVATNNIKTSDFTVTQYPGYTYAIDIDMTNQTITVTYTANKYEFTGLHVYGLPERFQRVVEINGTRYTKSEIESYKPKFEAPTIKAVEIDGYTANVAYTSNVITVTYTAISPLNLDMDTDYYVTIKGPSGYIYYDKETNERNDTGSSRELSNNYIWRVSCDGNGNKTITNGQSGETLAYNASLTLEAVPFKCVAKVTVTGDGDNKGYATLRTEKAYNNGFLFNDDTNYTGLAYGVLSDRYGAGIIDGGRHDNPHLEISYYTKEQAETGISELTYRMVDWYSHIGKTGYQRFESLGLIDMEGFIAPDLNVMDNDTFEQIYMPLMTAAFSINTDGKITMIPDVKYYNSILNLFNKVSAITDIVLPKVGEAYKLSIRTKDYFKQEANGAYKVHRKYLKADGSLTENEAESSVFVLGKDGELFLFASNDNTELNYLTAEGEKTTGYDATTCAFSYGQMSTLSENDNIITTQNDRVGTFFLTINGKVVTVNSTTDTWTLEKDVPFMDDNLTCAIEMEDVEYPYNKPNLVMGNPDDHSGGYASIWLPFPMVLPEGVEAYRATSVENEGILILTQVNEGQDAVAAGGYILRDPEQTEDKATWTVLPAPAAPEKVVPYEKNLFCGSTENPTVVKETGSWSTFKAKHEGTAYVLAKKSNGIGYYKYTDTEYLPKGKAIWFSNYKADAPANCLQFSFDEVVTAIEALHGNTTAGTDIYDLQGRRLDKAVKGQINVINGKKVMFK